MNASANYRAALSFLHRNETPVDRDDEMRKVEFNRPIGGGNRRPRPVEDHDPDDAGDEGERNSPSRHESQGFRKKRGAERKRCARSRDEEEDVDVEAEQAPIQEKSGASKPVESEEDEFDDLTENKEDDHEAEFDSRF